MSARSFRSVFMVASCAGAALGCYLVSLRVASERAELESVENRIVLAQRDIRSLQTEIGTRGRLAQLERWNVKVLALSAPSADQFLEGGFQLARLARPEQQNAVEAPVVLASAPAPEPRTVPLEEGERVTDGAGASVPAARLMREASLKVPVREVEEVAPAPKPVERKAIEAPHKAPAKVAAAAQKKAPPKTASVEKKAPVKSVTADKKAPAKPAATAQKAAPKKAGDKKVEALAKPVTKPVRMAKADPLAPLPAKATVKKSKDSGTAR